MELKDAHVVVTGASRGIGAAMARKFAAEGARVSLVARSQDALDALAAELGGTAFVADLGDAAQVDALIPQIEAEAGPIDVLVNNAGLENASWFVHDPAEVQRSVVRLNLEAPILLTRAVLPGMLRRGKGGLVFVSSLAGSASFPGLSVYGATKAGLNNLAGALRQGLKGSAIGITLVQPGPTDTQMWDHLEDQEEYGPMLRRLRRLQLIPKKTPELIARRTVAAVAKGRRHVRTPRRLSLTFWLNEAPRRISEGLLVGVPMGSAASPTAAD